MSAAARLVDTDVFSFLFKGDTRAHLYTRHLAGNELHLAFATVAELYRWVVRHGWGQARVNDLREAVDQCTMLGCDDATAWEWARVMSIKGRPVAQADAWVAAVALRHGMPLVTHNRRHFDGIPGLTIISEG
jgi:tRNA(fMet)-specific endonuclease VapC